VYPKGSAGFQPAAFGILPEAWARAECNPTPAPARRQDASEQEVRFGVAPARTFVPLPAITREGPFGGAPKAAREGACAPQNPVSPEPGLRRSRKNRRVK